MKPEILHIQCVKKVVVNECPATPDWAKQTPLSFLLVNGVLLK